MSRTAVNDGRCLFGRVAAHCLVVCVALLFAAAASAHHRGVEHPVPADAIAIPNLAHGQMTVVAANKSAILDLAGRMPRTDPIFRRLVAFINLQFSACMWGLMPGSITDERSPFNECTHAYLAATKALLVHMQTMPDRRAETKALVDKIQREMAAGGTSLVMCRYSDEPFNTAERMSPRWGELLTHAPSVLTFAGLAMLCVGSILCFVQLTRAAEPVAKRLASTA